MSRLAFMSLLLLMPALPAEPSQDRANGSIEGVVVSMTSNQPIQDARLTLQPVRLGQSLFISAESIPPPVTTGPDGRFLFKSLRAGAYWMDISSNGYVRQSYGQRTFPGEGISVEVADGQSVKGITVRMSSVGSISGHIREKDTRQPLANVPVSLLRFQYEFDGRRILREAFTGRTDERGEYRIYFVTPGRYYLSAGGTVSKAPGEFPRQTNEVPATYAPVYYPDVTDTNDAAILEVKPAAELGGIDLNVSKQEMHKLRGRVIDSKTGQPPPSANVTVYRRFESNWEWFDVPSNYRGLDGSFEIRGLASGSYLLMVTASSTVQRGVQLLAPAGARARVQSVSFPGSATPIVQASGSGFAPNMMPVEISNSDVEGIVVSMSSGISLTGSIRIEPQAISGSPLSRIQVRMTSSNRSFSKAFTVSPQTGVNSTATLSAENIPVGEYRISVNGMPAAFYVKDVRFGGTDVLHNPVQISDREPNSLSIVVSPNSAAINGVVRNERLEPANGSKVVLVPDRDRDRAELFQYVIADSTGGFKFSTVAPGNYRIFAWEAIEPFGFFDPELLRRLEQKGQPVRIEESSQQNVALTVIPAN